MEPKAAAKNSGSQFRGRRGVDESDSGIMDERILILVFGRLNWDPHVVCLASRVNRWLRAVANRVLWREVCLSRAPQMMQALTSGGPQVPGLASGGWLSLAKLLFYCCGGGPSQHFPLRRLLPGHFVGVSRFSKTSGRSFLPRRCWGDLLFVSDPCEHAMEGAPEAEDLGAYRGVFRGFMRSRTRACLIKRQAELELRVRCPYCRARVWSMTAARLVPLSAGRRLGAHHGRLEYFVCVNGHLHGNCWLAHLSTDDDAGGEEDGSGSYNVEQQSEDDDVEDDDSLIAC